jgi:CRP-like cAMP-binding protein
VKGRHSYGCEANCDTTPRVVGCRTWEFSAAHRALPADAKGGADDCGSPALLTLDRQLHCSGQEDRMRRIACESCTARAASLVCDVPPDVLGDLQTAGSTMLYRPRQVIFGEGTPASGLFLLCHGAVKLYHSDRFGRDHILEIAGPGALIGELALDEEATLSVSAEAVTEAHVSSFSRERLTTFMQRHPETAIRFLAALSRELAVARRKARDLALKGAESRLAGLLLQLARVSGTVEPGRPLGLRYSRRELAEMIGVSTETVIRLLAALKRKGAIRGDGRDVVLTDVDRLTRIAHHDEARDVA